MGMGPRRIRIVALWMTLAVVAAATGSALALRGRAQPPAAPQTTTQAAATSTATPSPARAPEPPKARRKPAKPKLPDGRSIRSALRRALLTGAIDRAHWVRWRQIERQARRAAGRLRGARQAELSAAIRIIDGLAAAGQLTASRMPLAFLTLERNEQEWTGVRFPRPGERMTFGRDPAVFQYFARHGIAYHALASAGRANALGPACLRAHERRERRLVARAAASARAR